MDYYNKYTKYKTKYIELKYNNNQCGETGKYICLPNTTNEFSTYSKCKIDFLKFNNNFNFVSLLY